MSKINLEREQVPIEATLISLLQKIPTDSGLRYSQTMYDSLNPALINYIVTKGREVAKTVGSKRGVKVADIYFTLGGDSWSKSLFVGFISSMLWIEDYILSVGDQYGVTENERKEFSKILRKVNLPTLFENLNPDGKIFGARTYAQILANFVVWLSRSSIANHQSAKIARSNREIVESLTTTALDSFPAIPFTAYHLATVKADESSIHSIAETISREVGWKEYLSDEFISINQPQFVVTASTAPIVGIVGHPLCSLEYGVNENGNISWISGFANSPEFDRLCASKGLSSKTVRDYINNTSVEKYKEDIEAGVPVAKMLERQKITPEIFIGLKPNKALVE